MNFINRLKFYVGGFGIGCMLVYFFFGNRACNGWLPGSKVKSAIYTFPLYTSKKMSCELENIQFSYDSLALFIQKGDIDFNQSQVKTSPRVYHVTNNGRIMKVAVDFQDTLVYVQDLLFLNKAYPACDTLDHHFDIKLGNSLEKLIRKEREKNTNSTKKQ